MTPEGSLKRDICTYLIRRPDTFFWVQSSTGQWDQKKKLFRKKRSKFERNGIPDILCFLRVGTLPPIMVGLEVKHGKNPQTESQIKFEKDFKAFGGIYFVVRSIEDTQKALRCAEQIIKSQIPAR